MANLTTITSSDYLGTAYQSNVSTIEVGDFFATMLLEITKVQTGPQAVVTFKTTYTNINSTTLTIIPEEGKYSFELPFNNLDNMQPVLFVEGSLKIDNTPATPDLLTENILAITQIPSIGPDGGTVVVEFDCVINNLLPI